MLNERSDDDENLDSRPGVRKNSELLEQLLKSENRDNKDDKKTDQSQDDSLLRSLGFSASPSPPHNEAGRPTRKRPSDDRDDLLSKKRSPDGSQVCFNSLYFAYILNQHFC